VTELAGDAKQTLILTNHQTLPEYHTHTVYTAVFPGEPGLAVAPLIFHLFLNCTSFWDRLKLSTSFLTQSHQFFSRRPLCLIPSTSYVIQCLNQSLSSFRSTCPNHLNLLHLIIKTDCSSPKSSQSSSFFFPFIQLNHTNPTDHTHFSAIQLQFTTVPEYQHLLFTGQKNQHCTT